MYTTEYIEFIIKREANSKIFIVVRTVIPRLLYIMTNQEYSTIPEQEHSGASGQKRSGARPGEVGEIKERQQSRIITALFFFLSI